MGCIQSQECFRSLFTRFARDEDNHTHVDEYDPTVIEGVVHADLSKDGYCELLVHAETIDDPPNMPACEYCTYTGYHRQLQGRVSPVKWTNHYNTHGQNTAWMVKEVFISNVMNPLSIPMTIQLDPVGACWEQPSGPHTEFRSVFECDIDDSWLPLYGASTDYLKQLCMVEEQGVMKDGVYCFYERVITHILLYWIHCIKPLDDDMDSMENIFKKPIRSLRQHVLNNVDLEIMTFANETNYIVIQVDDFYNAINWLRACLHRFPVCSHNNFNLTIWWIDHEVVHVSSETGESKPFDKRIPHICNEEGGCVKIEDSLAKSKNSFTCTLVVSYTEIQSNKSL